MGDGGGRPLVSRARRRKSGVGYFRREMEAEDRRPGDEVAAEATEAARRRREVADAPYRTPPRLLPSRRHVRLPGGVRRVVDGSERVRVRPCKDHVRVRRPIQRVQLNQVLPAVLQEGRRQHRPVRQQQRQRRQQLQGPQRTSRRTSAARDTRSRTRTVRRLRTTSGRTAPTRTAPSTLASSRTPPAPRDVLRGPQEPFHWPQQNLKHLK